MHSKIFGRLAGTVLLAVFAAACGDQGPAITGDVNVTLQKTDAVLTQLIGDWSASVVSGDASLASVDPDTVETLVIRVTRIQFLPQGGEEAEDGSWVTLELGTPELLDLMALPNEGESPLVIASGSAEVGTYANVRLFTDSASIRFKGPITLGSAFEYDGNVDYPVEIPSVEQTGINTNLSFTVEADAEGNVNDVSLLFVVGSTLQNVTPNGNGTVMMTPVIHEGGNGSS